MGKLSILTRLSGALCAWYLGGLFRKVEVFGPPPDPRVSCGHGGVEWEWVPGKGKQGGLIGLYTQVAHVDRLESAIQSTYSPPSARLKAAQASEETALRQNTPDIRRISGKVSVLQFPMNHECFHPEKPYRLPKITWRGSLGSVKLSGRDPV